jgi:hypothetical protein
MFLPDPERMIFEPGEKIRQTAGEGGIDAEFVNHVVLIVNAFQELFMLSLRRECLCQEWTVQDIDTCLFCLV